MQTILDRISRRNRRKDGGFVLLDAIAGLALAMIVLGSGAVFYANMNTHATEAASVEGQNTAISVALNRVSQNIQGANPIMSAAPDELITETSQPDGTTILTRWVRVGSTIYQQTWSGFTKGYPYGTGLWIDPSVASGPAPDGDGTQVTTVSVSNVQTTAAVFTFFDKNGTAISATDASPVTAQSGGTNAIKRVDVAVSANTVKGGYVQNATSVAPRNTTGGESDGKLVAPVCPGVTVDTSSGGQPIVRWSSVPNAVSYNIYRNSSLAVNNQTIASGATQGNWTDTTVSVNPGDAIVYTVTSVDAAGNESTSCRPYTWRAQIAAPAFSLATVQPSTMQATDWTSGPDAGLGLHKPRMVFTWGAVAGADGYQLFFRPLNPADGTPLTQAYSQTPYLAGNITSYTTDDGGWNQAYEWYLKATAKSGQSSESTHVKMLTHPPAPTGVSVSAQYGGTAPNYDLNNGNNVITWNAVQYATSYDIWRYNSGSSGAVTRIGSVSSGTTTYTDTVPYGTTYTYYVAAMNEGQRGLSSGPASSPNPEANAVAETGAIATAAYLHAPNQQQTMQTALYTGDSHREQFTRASETTSLGAATTTSPAPAPVSQLQYPPLPALTPVSTNAGASRDNDKSNHIAWGSSLSATGYQVQRTLPGQSTVTCSTSASCTTNSGGVTALSFDDAAPHGSQRIYQVRAYNATGMSVPLPSPTTQAVTITQRPDAPALYLSTVPSLSSDFAQLSAPQNGDTGNSGATFCTSSTCSYELDTPTGSVINTQNQASGSTVAWPGGANPPGSTTNYEARSHNPALTNNGWSDYSGQVADNVYPGTFSLSEYIGDANGKNKYRYKVSLVNADTSQTAVTNNEPGETGIAWTSSAGASSITINRVSPAGEPTSTDGFLPASSNLSFPQSGGAAGNWAPVAAPGMQYNFNAYSVAPNGLQRPVQGWAFTTPADLPQWGVQEDVCSGSAPQLQASRLSSLTQAPWYGGWAGTNIVGDSWNSTNTTSPSPSDSSYSYFFSNTNTGSTTITSGPGMAYYYGLRTAIDTSTRGSANGAGGNNPDSLALRLNIYNYGTFSSGCGPQGGTWGQMYEPADACYGLTSPCQADSNSNRPHWNSQQ